MTPHTAPRTGCGAVHPLISEKLITESPCCSERTEGEAYLFDSVLVTNHVHIKKQKKKKIATQVSSLCDFFTKDELSELKAGLIMKSKPRVLKKHSAILFI